MPDILSVPYVVALLFPTMIVDFIGHRDGGALVMGVVEYAALFLSDLLEFPVSCSRTSSTMTSPVPGAGRGAG